MTSDTYASTRWRAASPAEVCQQIGRSALANGQDIRATRTTGEPADGVEACHDTTASARITLGNITLRPHQVDAVGRLRQAISAHGGAVLADTVGLGKTFVALALARDYVEILVLAPAGLLPMWRSAIATTDTAGAVACSLHALSRPGVHPGPGAAGAAGRTLVIIDEAHYLRTRTTTRYRNVAQICLNRDVLLISATPMHNRPRELRNLLSLFLGHRADAMDVALLAQCIVRRSGSNVVLPLPSVHEHHAMMVPDNPVVLECILTVAQPLPLQDGGAAGALIRLGLLKAWCSSDAALTDTIRRRQLRGEAMLQSLSQGRYPTARELQSWIAGSDSVQLGFPELLVQTAPAECADLIKTVTKHLDSLQGLLQLHVRTSHTDPMRAAYLRQLLREPDTLALSAGPADVTTTSNFARPPVLAFSQFASTVRALHRALGDIAGVASLTSAGGRIASGAIAREQLIEQFAPRANDRPPPRSHERISLLLTTDLLAEGVNLQDADTVVHLDLPWTDALRQQRIGRLARMGSKHAAIQVHTFSPPMGTERALRIAATLERKAGLHREWIGSETSAGAGEAPVAVNTASAAELATELHEGLRTWACSSRAWGSNAAQSGAPFPVAACAGGHPGFLAAIEVEGKVNLVAGTGNCVTATLHTVVSTMRSVQEWSASDDSLTGDVQPHAVAACVSQVERWISEQTILGLAGESSRQLAPLQQRALGLLTERLSSVPAIARRALRNAITHAEAQIMYARGAGAEVALLEWMGSAPSHSLSAWLAGVPEFLPVGHRQTSTVKHRPDHPAETTWRIVALLLLTARADNSTDALLE